MKKIISLVLLFAISLGCTVCVFASSETLSVYSSYLIPSGSMRMIAHRGYSSVAPENTLPSFIAAGQSDFWGAECDILRTSDGEWVLMHDDTVDRTTDGTGRVDEHTYSEIREMTVDAGNNVDKYPGTKVPTLIEYLDVCKEYSMHPVIEIKSSSDPDSMEELAGILMSREENEMFVIISFGWEICARIKKLMPETPVYLLMDSEDTADYINFVVQNNLDGLDMNCGLSEDCYKAVKKADIDIIIWTVDDIYTTEQFFKLGVRSVTTNSLTQEAPEGNGFQRFIWSIRDMIYWLFTIVN